MLSMIMVFISRLVVFSVGRSCSLFPILMDAIGQAGAWSLFFKEVTFFCFLIEEKIKMVQPFQKHYFTLCCHQFSPLTFPVHWPFVSVSNNNKKGNKAHREMNFSHCAIGRLIRDIYKFWIIHLIFVIYTMMKKMLFFFLLFFLLSKWHSGLGQSENTQWASLRQRLQPN